MMPFLEGASYPLCGDDVPRPYAPPFPKVGEREMGGTGLSGLALSEGNDSFPGAYRDVFYIANPITGKIQAIRCYRGSSRREEAQPFLQKNQSLVTSAATESDFGNGWRLEHLPDFIRCGDPWFRPVAIQFGPDGCLYFVDWYNKIISHNEVPRNHPERDKKRGRIWRVKYKEQTPFAVPDFTKLSGDELLAKLGGESTPQSHLAWQAITDRQMKELAPKLKVIITDNAQPTGRRIAGLWALEGLRAVDAATLMPLLADTSRNLRREAVRACGEAQLAPSAVLGAIESLADDSDPEVRAEVIRTAGTVWERGSVSRRNNTSASASKNSEVPSTSLPSAALESRSLQQGIALLARMAKPSLVEPTARSTHNSKTIKIHEAYEREFERYLVRMFLESYPEAVTTFLDSDAAKSLPIENRLVATLSLEPKDSATRVAKLLPQLTRSPGDEELLRLAQFPDEAGISDVLKAILQKPETRTAALESLLKVRTKLDASKLTPLLTDAARQLFAENNPPATELGIKLASSFQLVSVEPELVRVLKPAQASHSSGAGTTLLSALRALREIKSAEVDLFVSLLRNSDDAAIQIEAAAALATSRDPRGPTQ